jgi:hypothetical protein
MGAEKPGVVINKVMPEDPSAGFGQRPHPVGQLLLEAVIQNGGKDGGLVNDIKRPLGRIDLGRISHQDFYGRRQALPDLGGPILQKLIAA